MGGGMGGMGGMGGEMGVAKPVSYDIPIEVYGMVYIYNPVDTDRLGIEKVEAAPVEPEPESSTGDEEAEPTEPAADGSATPDTQTPAAADGATNGSTGTEE